MRILYGFVFSGVAFSKCGKKYGKRGPLFYSSSIRISFRRKNQGVQGGLYLA
jgi:hypothetical protein